MNVDSMPSGRLMASEWACESPTIVTRFGTAGTVVGVTGPAAGAVAAAAAAGVVTRTGASKAASAPPAARSYGSIAM